MRGGQRPERALVALLIGAALLALGSPAQATNGLKLTAYGARAAGRGGVDYAFADDGIGPATNPAGMGFVYGNRLDNNWNVIVINAVWHNAEGTFTSRDVPFIPLPAFSFGAVFSSGPSDWQIKPLFDFGHWGLEPDDEAKGPPDDAPPPPRPEVQAEDDDRSTYGSRLKIGFGVFPVTGGRVQLKDMRVDRAPGQVAYGGGQDWELDTLTLAVTPSVAYRFNKYFSAGVSLQIIYSQFELDGGIAQPVSVLADNFEFASSILSINPQTLTFADLDDAKLQNGALGIAGRIGLMFTSQYFSVGMVYQERSHSTDYLGRAAVDASDEVNSLTNGNPNLLRVVDGRINPALGFGSNYDLRIQRFEQMPRMFGLGIAVRPHRRISLGLDYTYIHWSEIVKTFKVRLSHGSNPNLDIMTSPTIPVRVPLNFEDQHVIALGATVLAAEGDDIVEGVPSFTLLLRAGYNFGKNPTPANTTLPQQPTIGEHHISAGLSLYLGPLVELSAAWEWTLPTELNTGNHIGDFTLSNSRQELSLMMFHFGVGVNF